MFNVASIIPIIIAVILGIAACVCFFILLKVYLNRRLKGEGKIRKMPQPLMVVLTIILTVSVICNAILVADIAIKKDGLDKLNDSYTKLNNQTQPQYVTISEFSDKNSEYLPYRECLLNGKLAGYEITVKTGGDFECYVGLPDGQIGEYFFMPQYFIYIRYIGEPLESAQMERRFYYDETQNNGNGSAGQFKPELLIIGNNLEPHFYFGIKTIVKLASETKETKQNWDSLPIYTQSFFVIKN